MEKTNSHSARIRKDMEMNQKENEKTKRIAEKIRQRTFYLHGRNRMVSSLHLFFFLFGITGNTRTGISKCQPKYMVSYAHVSRVDVYHLDSLLRIIALCQYDRCLHTTSKAEQDI